MRGGGWSCSLPPRKKIPFQQEGLKLDLQKDFLTESKGVGHRLGEERRPGKVWAKGLGLQEALTTFRSYLLELDTHTHTLQPTRHHGQMGIQIQTKDLLVF